MNKPPETNNELSDKQWDILADCLQQFCEAWDRAITKQPSLDIEHHPTEGNLSVVPRPRDFLPQSDDNLERATLIELIKLDMEYRGQNPQLSRSLKEYEAEYPELCKRGKLPADLINEAQQLLANRDIGDKTHPVENWVGDMVPTLSRVLNQSSYRDVAKASKAAVAALKVGDQIDDFDLLIKLGQGAFATVFLARQNSLGRLVALKLSADSGREPQLLAQLDHRHIVRVYDQRVLKEPPLRLMYMQHIPGGTLQETFQKSRQIAETDELDGNHLIKAVDHFLSMRGEAEPVSSENRRRLMSYHWNQVVSQIGNEIAQALSYAHQKQLLHRDLKPANVLLDKDCHVKIVDFNISYSESLEDTTPASYFGGSMAYMSPEQLAACHPHLPATAEQLDGRSDIYSAGVMMFELLVGCRPFQDTSEGTSPFAMLDGMIACRKEGLSDESREKLPPHSPTLARIIERCVQNDPKDRYQEAETLATHLLWAKNPNSSRLFAKPSGLLARLASLSPFLISCILTMGISSAAVLFISTYNLDVSVPEGARGKADSAGLFQQIMLYTNVFWFCLGGLILFILTRPVAKALLASRQQTPLPSDVINAAIRRNLKLGHLASIMSMAEWTLGGLLYPVAFTLFGFSMDMKMSFDFIFSHLIAAVLTGSYVFWTLNYFAIHLWQPRLLEMAMQYDAQLNWKTSHQKTEFWCGIYHVLATATPLIAIAWIVLVSDHETDERSLTALSVIGLGGLALLVWVSRRVRQGLTTLRSFDANQSLEI